VFNYDLIYQESIPIIRT